MEIKKLVRRTEEKRQKLSMTGATFVLIILLAAIGITSMIDGLESKVTCNGITSCSLVYFGSWALVLIGIIFVGLIVYLIYYKAFKWKEIKPNESKRGDK